MSNAGNMMTQMIVMTVIVMWCKMVTSVLFREEKERKARYLKEREVRDAGRDQMRDKYKITKKPREEEEEESEEEDDAFGPKKKSEPEDVDAVTKAKKQAVEKMQDATNMVSSLFKF